MIDVIKCPGCGEELTEENAGGYRTYCQDCVADMPSPPNCPHGFVLTGVRGSFKWECAE